MAQRTSRRTSASRPAAPRASAPRSVRGPATMPFDAINYRLLLGALALVVLGYALMLIDNATSANPVDSVLSLYIAPLLLLAGYLGVAGAVLWGVPREADPTAPDDSLEGPTPATA